LLETSRLSPEGLATAKRFVQEGMDQVFITGRGKEALDAAAAEIGKNVTAVQGDVAKLSDLDRLYETVNSIRQDETERKIL
jgi:NADP-dependent 3-hydroxy acid dehydrogenase YdfG